MPGWFAAFLVLIGLGLLVAAAILWRRRTRYRRSRALAADYAVDTTAQGHHSASHHDLVYRLHHGCLVWKHAFSTTPCVQNRALRRMALVGKEAVFVSRRDAHRVSHVRRTLTETDHRIPLTDILAVQLGPVTRGHRSSRSAYTSARGDRCMSILTNHRSYDLEMLTDTDLADWVLGLQGMVEEHQKWAGLPMYTAETLAEAQKDIRQGRLPPCAFAFRSDASPVPLRSPRSPRSPRRASPSRTDADCPVPPAIKQRAAAPSELSAAAPQRPLTPASDDAPSARVVDVDCAQFP